jgi:CheY-like chemotaxis protein
LKRYGFFSALKGKIIMARSGPILIIEDDPDDQYFLVDALKELKIPNEVRLFGNCLDAFHYLNTTKEKPFLIFSDINLPLMSGAELKKKINEVDHIRRKSIPFVFLTTTANHEAVLDAYESLAQGFFTKPDNMDSFKRMIEMILNYWKISRHPDPNLI